MHSPRSLPQGVVTLLFTDVEGSTRLWDEQPERMRAALVRHDNLLTQIIESQGGIVVKERGEGDSFFAVFERAGQAAAAAIIAQRSLYAQTWPTSRPIRVRMALHTGSVEQRDRDYYGPTVNRCARLRALGHGGQVLLSQVTARIIRTTLPPGMSLRDQGLHRLKDLDSPEQVYQLVAPGMTDEFPPLRSPDALPMRAQVQPSPTQVHTTREEKVSAPPAYLLVDERGRADNGVTCLDGQAATASGIGGLGRDGLFTCYSLPELALLWNPIHGRIANPRLLQVQLPSGVANAASPIVSCDWVMVQRTVDPPRITLEHRVRYAVFSSLEVFDGGIVAFQFSSWARAWLDGTDRSESSARAMARLADEEAYRSGFLPDQSALAASVAAQAAAHAARVQGLGGRAAAHEAALAAEAAANAAQHADKIALLNQVDLVARACPSEEMAGWSMGDVPQLSAAGIA